jgi:chromosome segregation ATPase
LQTCAKLDQHNDSVSEKFKEMNLIRENLQIELNQVLAKFRDKCVEEERLNGELKIKESEIDRLKGELRNFEAMENFIKNLQKEAKSLEQERESLRAEYKSSISTFTEDLAARDLEIFNRDEEILRLSDIISSKDSEISNLNSESSHKSSQILSLQSSIVELTQVITSYKDLESKCKSLEALSKSHQSECVSLQSTISENLSSYKSSISLLSQEKDSNFQTISALQVEMQKLSTDLHEKLALYRSEQIITQELRTKSAIIQQKLCNTLDLNKLFTQVKYLSGQMTDLRDKLVEDNDELVRQVLQITEDYLNAGKVIQQVRDIIEDRDNEINILRDLIAELQNKTIYYPIKDDPVDEAIADYLNSRSEPLPVTFIREEYGIYLFGTKRVFIKLENNRIISKD